MENWKPYMETLGMKEGTQPYDPGYKKIFETMKEQWAEKQDVKNLFDRWLLKDKFKK